MTKGSLPVFIKKMFAFLLISVLMLSLAAEAFAEIRIDTHFSLIWKDRLQRRFF